MTNAPSLGVRALLLAAAGLLVACGGGGGGDGGGSHGGARSGRFLVAAQSSLTELTLTDGSETNLVSFGDGSFVLDPALSVDGTRVAFIRRAPSGPTAEGTLDFGADLYVAARDGSAPTLLRGHERNGEFIRSPVWLPDGPLVYAVQTYSDDGFPDYYIEKIDPETRERSRFIERGLRLSLGPDRETLLYTSLDVNTGAEVLWLTDVELSTSLALSNSSRDGIIYLGSPALAPDGTQVVFSGAGVSARAPFAVGEAGAGVALASLRVVRHGLPQDIWIVSSDGTGVGKLAVLGDDEPSLAWSGDGSRLFSFGGTGLWDIDPATGEVERIGNGFLHGGIYWLGSD